MNIIKLQSEDNLINAISLPEKWVKFLSEQPETGMGYQDVTISFKDGTSTDGFVANCEMLNSVSKINTEDIVDIEVNSKR